MKRMLCIALCCLLMCSLAGCQQNGISIADMHMITSTTNSRCINSFRAQCGGRTYCFTGGDFDFEITAFPNFGTASPQYTLRNLYYQKMYLWNMPELKKVCEKYNYRLCDDVALLGENEQYQPNPKALTNGMSCKAYVCLADFAFYNPDLPTGYTEFQFYVHDTTQIDNIKACAQEMITVLQSYFITNPHAMFKKDYHVYQCNLSPQDDQFAVDFEKITSGTLYIDA